jgi:hypothetical protein
MGQPYARAIFLVVIPLALIVGAGYLLNRLAGRDTATVSTPDGRPLYQRIQGYTTSSVARHWGLFDRAALKAERKFLELDLIYPFFYGGVLATALLIAWWSLGRPFSMAWPMAPIVVTACADWIENLTQLRQIERFASGGADALEGWCVSIGSYATMTKLVFLAVSVVMLGGLAIRTATSGGSQHVT